MGKTKKTEHSNLVEAAKRFAGDAEQDASPLTEDEEGAIADIRRTHKRPSADDLGKMAGILLKNK